MTRQSPCYGCTKRWVTDSTSCHAHCEDYIDDEAKKRSQKEQVYAHRLGDIMQAELSNKRKRRIKKRSKRR